MTISLYFRKQNVKNRNRSKVSILSQHWYWTLTNLQSLICDKLTLAVEYMTISFHFCDHNVKNRNCSNVSILAIFDPELWPLYNHWPMTNWHVQWSIWPYHHISANRMSKIETVPKLAFYRYLTVNFDPFTIIDLWQIDTCRGVYDHIIPFLQSECQKSKPFQS